MDLVAGSLQIQHPFSCTLFPFCLKVWWHFLGDGVTADDVGTKLCTLDTSDTYGGSAVFVDLYFQTFPSFQVAIISNFTPQRVKM